MSEGQKFAVTITATGEVRDADGNLLNTVDVDFGQHVLSEEDARELKARLDPEEKQ